MDYFDDTALDTLKECIWVNKRCIKLVLVPQHVFDALVFDLTKYLHPEVIYTNTGCLQYHGVNIIAA